MPITEIVVPKSRLRGRYQSAPLATVVANKARRVEVTAKPGSNREVRREVNRLGSKERIRIDEMRAEDTSKKEEVKYRCGEETKTETPIRGGTSRTVRIEADTRTIPVKTKAEIMTDLRWEEETTREVNITIPLPTGISGAGTAIRIGVAMDLNVAEATMTGATEAGAETRKTSTNVATMTGVTESEVGAKITTDVTISLTKIASAAATNQRPERRSAFEKTSQGEMAPIENIKEAEAMAEAGTMTARRMVPDVEGATTLIEMIEGLVATRTMDTVIAIIMAKTNTVVTAMRVTRTSHATITETRKTAHTMTTTETEANGKTALRAGSTTIEVEARSATDRDGRMPVGIRAKVATKMIAIPMEMIPIVIAIMGIAVQTRTKETNAIEKAATTTKVTADTVPRAETIVMIATAVGTKATAEINGPTKETAIATEKRTRIASGRCAGPVVTRLPRSPISVSPIATPTTSAASLDKTRLRRRRPSC